MAAGTACKLRLYQKSDSNTAYHRIFSLDKVQKLLTTPKCTREPCLFELQHTKQASNGATEISAPNAVFDGTGHVKWGLVSNDAKDTSNGVGTRTVKVIKLMYDGTYEVESITMNGTTAVATTETSTDYALRLMHMYATSWGTENDTAGTLTLATYGYQELGLTGKTSSSTVTGLSATTQYYFKINLNGAGATEYSITTASALTWGAILTLINADMATHSVACTWTLDNGDIRCTSNAHGSGTSTIALTAGSSGTDLFASITGCSVESAVNGGVKLTITAGCNESDGSAIFVPDDNMVTLGNMVVTQTTLANAGSTYAQIVPTGMLEGADPDMDTITLQCNATQTKTYTDDRIWESTGSGKITFKESYITGAETLETYISMIVYKEVSL